VNLKPRSGQGFSGPVSELLGRLLINDFQQTARNHRPANTAKPHVLVVDECQNYLSDDIPEILDGTRKYGLHLVLSHQRIEQLVKASPDIADGVMAGAQTKIIFGSSYATGTQIADEIFGAQCDLERPKQGLKKPFVTGYKKEILRGGADGRTTTRTRTDLAGKGLALGLTHGEQEGEGEADGVSASAAEGGAFGRDAHGDTEVTHWLQGSGSSHVDSRFRARSKALSVVASIHEAVSDALGEGRTISDSWHEALVPIVEWLYPGFPRWIGVRPAPRTNVCWCIRSLR
jgi:TraM recognition site of TraD and TraG